MVARKRNIISHLTRRFSSVLARKKKKGSAMFKARPKSLLSAIIEYAGPYTREEPSVKIITGRFLITRKPNDPAIVSTSHRSRCQVLMTAAVITVIRKTFETIFQR